MSRRDYFIPALQRQARMEDCSEIRAAKGRRNRRPLLRAALALALASGLAAGTHPASAQTLDLVTHNGILIAAPPQAIWPHINDPSGWKAGAQLVPLDEQGTRFKAVMPDAPDAILFHVANVEFDPPRRRTIRLNALDGALIGFASWELRPQGEGTWVAYHVYTQAPAPPDQPPPADYRQTNRDRFQQELETLRRLVEAPPNN